MVSEMGSFLLAAIDSKALLVALKWLTALSILAVGFVAKSGRAKLGEMKNHIHLRQIQPVVFYI